MIGNSEFQKRYGPDAVVTGSSEGIGRAVANELAQRGLNLVLVSRREDKLAELKNEILKKHPTLQIQIIPLDLSTAGASEVLFEKTKNLSVGLYAAIAGYGTSGDFINIDVAQELNMIDVNCRVVVEQSHHYANRFKIQGHGGLILMSSLVAFQGVPRAATYAATKAFMQTFAEGIYLELKPFNVDVLAVAPGPVNSGFAGRAQMKMNKAEDPDQIAAGIVNALGKKVTVRPGFLSKLLGWSLSTMPRWSRVKAMQKIMGQMTRKSS